MLSPVHRCLYVHLPKTGGSSIEVALTGHDWIAADAADYAIYLRERSSYTSTYGGTLCQRDPHYFEQRMLVKHAAQATLRQDHPVEWAEWLRFTFVRNPWDRALAIHRHGRRDAPERTPERFADWISTPEPTDHMGHPVFHRMIDAWDELHFIGRFEHLAADFARLAARLGSPELELPHVSHGSTPVDFREHYDARTRALVAERCADEIERFGYTFEPAPSASLT